MDKRQFVYWCDGQYGVACYIHNKNRNKKQFKKGLRQDVSPEVLLSVSLDREQYEVHRNRVIKLTDEELSKFKICIIFRDGSNQLMPSNVHELFDEWEGRLCLSFSPAKAISPALDQHIGYFALIDDLGRVCSISMCETLTIASPIC